MNDVMKMLPIREQEEVNPISGNDFIGDDGLVHCGKCGEPKQYHVKVEGFFDKIVPCTCRCQAEENEKRRKQEEYKEQMRRIARLKESSMMSSKFREVSFDRYKVRAENEKVLRIARKYVENFSDMRQKNQGLLFYGPVGTGKSYTAACIANALLNQSISVIMTSFVKILQDIQHNDDEAQYIAILNSATLLIIDDLGAERNTDYALEKVYNVIDSRIRINKPMILTTNLDLSEMMQTQDIRYKRVYDRIFECCYPVEMPGKSFRLQEAAARFEEMKNLVE